MYAKGFKSSKVKNKNDLRGGAFSKNVPKNCSYLISFVVINVVG